MAVHHVQVEPTGTSTAAVTGGVEGEHVSAVAERAQLVGGHVFSIAIATHTYSMTGAAWAYALQMLLSYLPWMLFSGIAGPIVDRLDRRQVMIVAAVSRGVLGFLYPYFTTIEPVLALNFISSTHCTNKSKSNIQSKSCSSRSYNSSFNFTVLIIDILISSVKLFT